MKFNISNLKDHIKLGIREIQKVIDFEISENEGMVLNANLNLNSNLNINNEKGQINIEYPNMPAFYKGLSMILSDESYFNFHGSPCFKSLGVMLDCSRNGVVSVDGAKIMIRYFALMGYNYLMLYTEDTIEVKGYPYFGYLRGRYSKDEIKEIESYCDLFGIELIPCIQTLAHLNQALRWNSFKDIKDVGDILLIGEEKTYDFIDALIKTCSENFRSRTMHIGMDEAFMVGLGKFLKNNGYKNRTTIMIEHLKRVIEICKKYGFSPRMWSDMFFTLAFGGYYSGEGRNIEREVLDMIPKEVDMVYWDYYSQDKAKYDNMFKKHLEFKNNIVFAAGAWCWGSITPDNNFSIEAAKVALSSAKENKIKDVFVACWGDDGAECSYLSILPSLMVYSELNYNDEFSNLRVEKQFKILTGVNFKDYLMLDCFPKPENMPKDFTNIYPTKYLLFQDVLSGIFDLHLIKGETASYYLEYSKKLNELIPYLSETFIPLFKSHALLCNILYLKSDLGLDIRKLYNEGNKEALLDIANNRIAKLIETIEEFYTYFKEKWLQIFKPFGLEVQDIRYGGLIMRLKTVKNILIDYCNGKISKIEELEQEILPYGNIKNPCMPYAEENFWSKIVSVNVLHPIFD